MAVTFGGHLPLGFSLALRQHIHELETYAKPHVEWNWRLTAVPGAAGVQVRIPARHIDQTSGWALGKEFISTLPTDIDRARTQLSQWFSEVHAQFVKETFRNSVGDVDVLG